MSDLSRLSAEQAIDIGELRQRLMKMSDTELLRFGAASKFMCSPGANFGKPPREVFVVQLPNRFVQSVTQSSWYRKLHAVAAIFLCLIEPQINVG
jgi:hypothetical protein